MKCVEVGDAVYDHSNHQLYIAVGPQELVRYVSGTGDQNGSYLVFSLSELKRIGELEVLEDGYAPVSLILMRWGCTLADLDWLTAQFLRPIDHRDYEKRARNDSPARTAGEEAAIFRDLRLYRTPGVSIEEDEF